jgi:hypothetical protein
MAIEFSCPQCTAVIRVPDAASGKKGSCPTCQTKLIVPTIQIPDPAQQVAEPPAPVIQPPAPIETPLFPFAEPAAPQPAAPQQPIAQPPASQQPAPASVAPVPFDPFALPTDTPPSPLSDPLANVAPEPQTPASPPPATADQSGVPPAPGWMKPNAEPEPEPALFASPPAVDPNAGPGLGFLDGPNAATSPAIAPPGTAPNPDQPGVAPRPPSMAARVRRRTKSKKSGMMFALFCGVGLVIGVGYMYVMQGPSLEGTRKGIMLVGGKMVPKTLGKGLIDVPADVMETVLTDFAENAQGRRLSSQLVTTAFRGTLEGLEVTITTGTESKFVQFAIDKDLRKYYDANQVKLNKPRQKKLKAAAKEFFNDWDVAIRNSETLSNFADYRDDVGLNTCRGALGFHVSARVGKGLYPCVYEDEGSLYFAVPPSTKRFKVVGLFHDSNKKSLFPGEYDVIVTQQKKPAPKPVTPEPDSDEPTME